MRKKNFPILLFLVLVIAIAVAFFAGSRGKISLPKTADILQTKPTPSPAASASPGESVLPIALDNANITGAYAHYYFTGKVSGWEKTDSQTELILDGADKSLPIIVIDKSTRFWRISLPYSPETMIAIGADNIKAGMTVDVSMEYDLKAKNWVVRDIYLPADRNP